MAKIVYRPHLTRRLKERKIPRDYPEKIYRQSKVHYFDEYSNHQIAISRLKYAGKIRHMVVAYDKIGGNIEIVTIHPISKDELKSKIDSGRWQKK